MFGLVVRFNLKEGEGASFDTLVEATAARIRISEPGTLIYATHAVEGDGNARVFYELYRDREAFEEHERQEHTRRFLAEREQYFAAPPRVEFLEPRDGASVLGSR